MPVVATWQRPVTGSIIVVGQSNAVFMCDGDFGNCNWGAVTYAGNFYLFRTIADYSDMNDKRLYDHWQSGSGENLYERLITLLQSLPANQKHVIFWAQGEGDAASDTRWADAYQSNFSAFISDVHTDSGLDKDHLRWSVAILHTGNTNPNAATVRTALINVVAAGDGTTYYADGVDVSTGIGITDGVRWDSADRATVGNRMLTSANTLYGFSQRSTAAVRSTR